MIPLRRAVRSAALALLSVPVALTLTAAPASADPRERSQTDTGTDAAAARARRMLGQLKVARPLSIRGYSHRRFQPRWAHHKGACDAREMVLARDGRGVRRDRKCRAIRGRWYSPYEGKWFRSERLLDVDHVVPLAYAWRSGARRWSQAKRRAFANDLTRPELVTVSHSMNIAKGGQGPQSWRPPRRAYWCRYATSWITVKHHYRLFVTRSERVALRNMLRTCR
ncbi:HNH endonuclease family protein [Nonomuraea sp. NPDC050328]|uniref:HNH endonuclease family protein n=1 Tax=Nonomuraea sp. NPDC050328 TaxID=3364361 RepID=UPI0037B7A90C